MHAPTELEIFASRLETLGAPYMVTGATAAILYGQPRTTNDLDVVLSLDEKSLEKLLRIFPEEEFYVPPESVIRAEQARAQRGHFNLIHHESGYKADIYLAASDPLHAWAFPQRRRVTWNKNLTISVAPPEYVVLRKLEFYREGRSAKHLADIRAIMANAGVDEPAMTPWLKSLGLESTWAEIKRSA